MVTIILRGGLGNQLFQLYAAKALSFQNNQELKVLFALGKKGAFQHGESIHNLHLQFEYKFAYRTLENNIRKRIEYRFPRSSFLLDNSLNRFVLNYRSEGTGFDSRLMTLKGNKIIDGYFQTFKYYEYVFRINSEYSKIKPRNCSHEYNYLSKIISDENPIVLHMRRGDYAGNKNTGLLSQGYYLNAFESLESKNRPVWIFSDDIQSAKKELTFLRSKKCKWISKFELNRPSENLCLMSLSSDIIIGNSTFSYWAAILNHAKNVIAPAKWFQNQKDPQDLYPPQWKQVSSSWVT